jgi:hypothetical protein
MTEVRTGMLTGVIDKGDIILQEHRKFVRNIQSGGFEMPESIVFDRVVTVDHIKELKFIVNSRISLEVADMYLDMVRNGAHALTGVICLSKLVAQTCSGHRELSFRKMKLADPEMSRSQGMFRRLFIPWVCPEAPDVPFAGFVHVVPQETRVSIIFQSLCHCRSCEQLGVHYQTFIFDPSRTGSGDADSLTVEEPRIHEVCFCSYRRYQD